MNASAVPDQPAKPNPSTVHRGAHGDRKALVQLQRDMHAIATDKSVLPHIRAKCADTWQKLQLCKRIMDGKPLPGQLRPDWPAPKPKRKGPAVLPMPEVPSHPIDEVKASPA
jgi:hypothetical protein